MRKSRHQSTELNTLAQQIEDSLERCLRVAEEQASYLNIDVDSAPAEHKKKIFLFENDKIDSTARPMPPPISKKITQSCEETKNKISKGHKKSKKIKKRDYEHCSKRLCSSSKDLSKKKLDSRKPNNDNIRKTSNQMSPSDCSSKISKEPEKKERSKTKKTSCGSSSSYTPSVDLLQLSSLVSSKTEKSTNSYSSVPALISSNCSPSGFLPDNDCISSHSSSIQHPLRDLEQDNFIGRQDFPVFIVDGKNRRICHARMALFRPKSADSQWLSFRMNLDDVDGSQILQLNGEIKGRQLRKLEINGKKV